MKRNTYLFAAIFFVLCAWSFSGCRQGAGEVDLKAWRKFADSLAEPDRVARLDLPTSKLTSSFDPTWQNIDYNHYVRNGPNGWWVIADLKGPGYVSRFWLTGILEHYGIRIYFDDEKKPSIETTVAEFLGARDQSCWRSYVPITYSRRLVIMVQEPEIKPDSGERRRLFYQINSSCLPQGTVVPAFPRKLTGTTLDQIKTVWKAWREGYERSYPEGTKSQEFSLTVGPGKTGTCATVTGPCIIRELRLKPDLAGIESAVARERVLKDVILRITWDNAEVPSVDVPLGCFFGSFPRRTRFSSMFVGMKDNTFWCRFPMPFRESARISLENKGKFGLRIEGAVDTEPLAAWDDNWGYFHSGWRITTAEDVGRPHVVLSAKGAGKFVGCILGVGSLDKNWWLLEGNETIRVDNEAVPGWRGTGLEDYFNGGWYYSNPAARPLYGLLFKAPFRTVQYRFHINDAVNFGSSIDMVFERGPRHVSRGWMESVAYYYLRQPRKADSDTDKVVRAVLLPETHERATIMTELINQERFNDYQGAYEHIDEFLESYTNFQDSAILRLRQIGYMEQMQGFEVVKDKYNEFILEHTDKRALQQAQALMWRREKPFHALVGLYCNAMTRVFIDGRQIIKADHPEKMFVIPVILRSGPHVIAIEAKYTRPYGWVQFWLKGPRADIVSGVGWRFTEKRIEGNWKSFSFDDSSWTEVIPGNTRGPPQFPFIKLEPNAFVATQARAMGMTVGDNKTVLFRKRFKIRGQH